MIVRFKQQFPAGIFTIFLLQIFTMIGFSINQSVLVLYTLNVLHMSEHQAYSLFGAYMSLVFGASVLGGYIASIAGYRRTFLASLLLGAVGLFSLAIPGTLAFYFGLSSFIISTAMSVPTIFVLLGRLYETHDVRRDSGFTIAYIGMNVGAFVAMFSAGYIQEYFNYSTAFVVGGFFMVISYLLFFFQRKNFKVNDHIRQSTPKPKRKKWLAVGLGIGALPLVGFLLTHSGLSNILLIVLGFLSGVFILFQAFKAHKLIRAKLLVFWILTVVSIIFWALYMLAPSALNIFVDRNVNKLFLGFNIPTITVQSLNPFFIMIVGPILSIVWLKLAKKGIDLSAPFKFAIGILLMGLGYLILIPGIKFATAAGVVAFGWIIASYFFQTCGELFIGPVGYAMVGTLVPVPLLGIMMGIWQLATGVAGALSDYLAEMTITPSAVQTPLVTDPTYAKAFAEFGLVSIVVGIAATLIAPTLTRIMNAE